MVGVARSVGACPRNPRRVSVVGWRAGAGRLPQRDELAVDDRPVRRLQYQEVDSNETRWQDSSLRPQNSRANLKRPEWPIACAVAVAAKLVQPNGFEACLFANARRWFDHVCAQCRREWL